MWYCCLLRLNKSMWPVIYLTAIIFEFVDCFNVDEYNYATYAGPQDSMFGFSVAIHKESNRGWIIVGAPEAQSTFQRDVNHGGAVYKCPTDTDSHCEEIPFDTKGDQLYTNTNQRMDSKMGQWFGATVSSSGSDGGPVVACAPRYHWYPKRSGTRKDPVGTCYVSDGSFEQFNEYSPCRTFHWGYHRQGSCQAGFSAAINSVGDRLFIGAPGSWYWQGQMYSIDAHAVFPYKPSLFSATYGAEGQVHQQSLESRPAVFSTKEGREKDDDSYMGYSTIVGNFLDSKEQSVAVGMPRGNELKGKVVLFSWNLTQQAHHFSSDQLGSYYGYALCASDVDGDGALDLIVGAPLYTVANTEGRFDVGRVYVIYQKSSGGRFAASYVLDGVSSGGRFGQALGALGDINQDGFGDFAVGAPYDGPNRRGAVYIYHGSAKGIRNEPSQVITAEQVIASPWGALTTFGFSITSGMDIDGNGYPDFGVGAYHSDRVFFFRSSPVVRVDSYVKFLTPKKEIDIKKADYTLKKGGKAALTKIDFCIKYQGKGIPHHIDLGVQYILDKNKAKNPRMGFVENQNTNILNDTLRLYKDKPETCVTKQVYVRSDIRDKLTPMMAEVRYWMQGAIRARLQQTTRNPRSQLQSVLDTNSPPSRTDSITVHKECGDDNICIPNLKLNAKPNVDQYLLGSADNLTFDVIVSNTGEDSFESMLYIKYPESIYYSRKDDKQASHVLCNTYGANLVKCELGNPIQRNKVVRFKLYWQPSIHEGMAPSYEFDLHVNSTNEEPTQTIDDNSAHLSVAIWSNSTLELTGKSHPNEVYFNSSLYTEDISIMKETIPFEKRLQETAIGPQVTHVYYLHNEGPATIREAEVFFVWPSLTLGGEDFVYLLETPHFAPSDNVKCDAISANHLNFNIERNQKSIWERLHLSDTVDTTSTVTVVAKQKVKLSNRKHSSSSSSVATHHRRKNATTTVSSSSTAPVRNYGGRDSTIYSRGGQSQTASTGGGRFVIYENHPSSTTALYTPSTYATERQYQRERINGTCCGVDGSSTSSMPDIREKYGSTPPPSWQYPHEVRIGGGGRSGSAGVGAHQHRVSGSSYASSTVTPYVTLPYNASHYFGFRNPSDSTSRTLHAYQRSTARYNRSGLTSTTSTGTPEYYDSRSYYDEYYGSGGNYDDNNGNNDRNENDDDNHHQEAMMTISGRYASNGQYVSKKYTSQQSHRSSSSGTIVGDRNYRVPHIDLGDFGAPTTTSRPSHPYQRRTKRHVHNPYPDVAVRFPCKALQCSYMRCVVASLTRDKTVTVALRARINARVLREINGQSGGSSQPTVFSSIMAARISKLPYIGQPLDRQLYFHEINTTVPSLEVDMKADVVPLWVVILSAVAGAIILLLLILLLYKLGFFKRKRPSSAPERQPLNRNGYHHDEAL